MNKNPLEHFPTENRLHTDVLEDRYGPIHAEVLRHDNEIREAHLKDERGVSRTYALTFFPEKPANDDIALIDGEIKSGELIGKAFRAHGYEIRKNVIDVFVLDIPERLKKSFDTQENLMKARLTEFYAKKEGEDPVIYATVLEAYSPDFREAKINETDVDQVNPTTEMFQKVGISIQEVWDRLPQASQKDEWADHPEQLKEAKKLSQKKVGDLKKKIDNYLSKE